MTWRDLFRITLNEDLEPKRKIIEEICELGEQIEAQHFNTKFGMKMKTSNLRAKARRRLNKLTIGEIK